MNRKTKYKCKISKYKDLNHELLQIKSKVRNEVKYIVSKFLRIFRLGFAGDKKRIQPLLLAVRIY